MGLDPNYLYDNADVLWYGTNGYYNALSTLKIVTGKSTEAVESLLNGKYGAADYWTASQALDDLGVVQAYNTNGYRCFAYADKVTQTVPTGPMYEIDSNQTATSIVKAAPAYDTVIDDVATSPTYNKVLVNPMGSLLTPQHGFYGWQFFAGECLQAINCASAGITLGKTIDSALYNLNPDFWDANGMKSLDPETWNSITNGDDSFAAGLFNTIFGLNPDTGNGQMFMDENALAYLAYWMKTVGVFDAPDITVETNPDPNTFTDANVPMYLSVGSYRIKGRTNGGREREYVFIDATDSSTKYVVFYNVDSRDYYMIGSSLISGEHTVYEYDYENGSLIYTGQTTHNYRYTSTYNGKATNYFSSDNGTSIYVYDSVPTASAGYRQHKTTSQNAWLMMYNSVGGTSIEGIGNQDNATLPDVSNWNDVPSTLQSLQNQYPDLWNNAVPNTIVQPDGSTKTITYVPVAMPNANGQWDTQPTSGNSTQTNPQVQPQPNPTPENNDLLKLLLQLITMPEPQPDTETQTQTKPQPNVPNPPTTGDGDSPTPTPISGSASALWSVYHPTQAQVNSFGAWLWTGDIITQIQQVLQNPMEGIITLHKVFAMPVDSGSGTIVVGRLDSQVPSATVNQQYVTVDCGSVNCSEYFGTVFDYQPYTDISLYLPFIGIVPLNVDDVMRSSIHVVYGVDVFTGACLAMVEISRDGFTVNMYQYSGVASVEYPLTGSVHSGLISGLLGIAGGVVASVASGGITAPAALAAVGGAASASKSRNSRASSFSGNSGAMGIKIPYLIIERPQIKMAETFPSLSGYPTNYSCKLKDCSGHVVVKYVHVEGINATDNELSQIESILKDGVIILSD